MPTRLITLPPGTDPFAATSARAQRWPALWIARDDDRATPHVTFFRLPLSLDAPWTTRLHFTGDEWFEFFIDGGLVARGPALSSPQRWLYHSVELELPAGEHEFLARVLAVGSALRPEPLMSTAPGFLCASEPGDARFDQVATGKAAWEWCDCSAGWTFHPAAIVSQTGSAFGSVQHQVPATGSWPPSAPADAAWSRTFKTRPAFTGTNESADARLFPNLARPPGGRRIHPRKLRHVSDAPRFEAYPSDSTAVELAPWQPLFAGGSVTLPAGARVRLLVDFDDYVIGHARLTARGSVGAQVILTWSERMLTGTKDRECWSSHGSRSIIEDHNLAGPFDEWNLAEGGEWCLSHPWRRCGRYVELFATAGPQGPLTLGDFTFEESLPPSRLLPAYQTDDALLADIQPACRRVLEVGADAAFCDCPFFEQVQWVGDLYPILLCNLALGPDEPMHRQALQLVADSVRGDLPTQARFPVNERKGNCVILSFSLWYVITLHDFALWRGHRGFVRSLAPTLRRNLEIFLAHRTHRGLYATPPGWNYFDWAPGFEIGCPPTDAERVCGPLNLLLARALDAMAALDAWLDEPELAARWSRLAAELAPSICGALWREDRGLFADAPGIDSFSEHTQTLALLDPALPAAQRDRLTEALARLENTDFHDASHGLIPLQPFFSHHLFEALTRAGRIDVVFKRLRAWQFLIDADLRTTPETMPGTRSDCHGWSAHPAFHTIASFAGVRPEGFGFERVVIRPQLGRIASLSFSVWTPKGEMHVGYTLEAGQRVLRATLPPGLVGTLVLPDGARRPLEGKVVERWAD